MKKCVRVPCISSDASDTTVTSEFSGVTSIHLWVRLLSSLVYADTKDASLSCMGSLHLYL